MTGLTMVPNLVSDSRIKYAMVWTTSRGYMPGTNASLNAMELYKWSGVDVFILTGGDFLEPEYKSQWPNVRFVDFNTYVEPGKDGGWYYVYAQVIYALELLKKYEVVLIWGGDLCILDNFTEYFEISEKLGAIVVGTNEHGSHYLSGLSTKWPYPHTWGVPYADVPFFVPRSRTNVLELMLKYNTMKGCAVDYMDGMNYAIRDLSARVHAVPGEHWIFNVPYRWKLELGKDYSIYIADSSTRLKSFHRRYWSAAICHEYLPGGSEPWSSISRNNKMLFNKMYNILNTQCRVKWTESLEVWNGE